MATNPPDPTPTITLVDDTDKRELMDRLARIAGQIEGVRKMIEREESCEKVAQQLAAARAALGKAFAELMARTIERNCLSPQDSDPDRQCRVEAIARILATYA